MQLVARNHQLRTEVEFPCSVQLVARKNAHKVNLSCIKMHVTHETANNVRILNEMLEIGLKPTQKMLILQKKA